MLSVLYHQHTMLRLQVSAGSRARHLRLVAQTLARTRSFVRRYSASPERTQAVAGAALRRSYLYVPASSDRMLQKSLTSDSDVIIYDLEDSVPPSITDKDNARSRLASFIESKSEDELPRRERLSMRVNAVSTPFFQEDILQALQLDPIQSLVLPKIHSAQDLHLVSRQIYGNLQSPTAVNKERSKPLQIIASIESARALFHVGEIAAWQSEFGPLLGGQLVALLFAAEDYCADTSIIRTPTRQELLFTRSQIAITAKAFGLDAIDMVCVNYKDLDYLKDECADGRRLGYTGKQAIHPSQVDIIQSTFVPSSQEILRATRILQSMEQAHSEQRGAVGLATEDGGKEMIDAPMLKQAENTIRLAMAAGLEIPKVD